MKFRLKKVTHYSGNVRYYPQVRKHYFENYKGIYKNSLDEFIVSHANQGDGFMNKKRALDFIKEYTDFIQKNKKKIQYINL